MFCQESNSFSNQLGEFFYIAVNKSSDITMSSGNKLMCTSVESH